MRNIEREDVPQSEIVGIALQKIGSILENDPEANLKFSVEEEHGFRDSNHFVEPNTTSVTLEVSGVDE